jgi:4-alpha-glucanotransferase
MLSAMESVANTCILCMQDLIGLNGFARMNKPSTVGTNWKWRAARNQITEDIAEFLKSYTEIYKRC